LQYFEQDRYSIIESWQRVDQSIIELSDSQWRLRLRACVTEKGGHFKPKHCQTIGHVTFYCVLQGATENARPENAGLENDGQLRKESHGLENAGSRQKATRT